MTTNVDLEKLQKDAVDIFNQGFACSESVIYAIKENFELDMSDDAIAMSSGFPWGLGGGGYPPPPSPHGNPELIAIASSDMSSSKFSLIA